MQQIQTFVSSPFVSPTQRRPLGGIWAGASKAVLLPIPIVAVVFVTLAAWLEP